MSVNLVGDYDSDGSDTSAASDGFFNTSNRKSSDDEEEPSTSENPATEPSQLPSTFKSALLGGDDSEESDEEAENEQEATKETRITKQYHLIQGTSREHLPSFDPSRNTELECNVFMNDIKREEFLNKKILSQHVSMTEIKVEDDKRKKMGACRAYKRGDCRRGDKCRFWHALPSEKHQVKPEEAAITVCGASLYTSEHDVFKKKKIN